MSGRISVSAPAKINLGLAVLSRRPDNYHDIVSVFQAIDWVDTLRMSVTPQSIELQCTTQGIPVDSRNLVWRAIEIVRQKYGIRQGVSVDLHKEIPAGAGLGGGSSDAAAALRGMRELFDLGGSEQDWLALCAGIGSDVPFFWHAGVARVEGRGELVFPLDLRERLWLVVAVPPVHVSTAWAYANLPAVRPDPRPYVKRVDDLQAGAMKLMDFVRDIPNDFEPAVESVYPEIGQLRKRLFETGAVSTRMSGSGSAVFGVYAEQCDAERAVLNVPEPVNARWCTTLGPHRDSPAG